MPARTTRRLSAPAARDVDQLIRQCGGRVRVIARLGAAVQQLGAATTWREARKLVKERGLQIDGDGRPQVDEVAGVDVLQVRCRWR